MFRKYLLNGQVVRCIYFERKMAVRSDQTGVCGVLDEKKFRLKRIATTSRKNVDMAAKISGNGYATAIALLQQPRDET